MKLLSKNRTLALSLRLMSLALAVLVVMGSSCEEQAGDDTRGSVGGSPTNATELVIIEPENDATVADDTVTIRGSASAGAEVRHKKRLRDGTFRADTSGKWEYTVELDEGENEFEFELSDNNDAKARLTITYDPDMGSAVEFTPTAEVTATIAPTATVSPTATSITSEWTTGIPVTQAVVEAILRENQGPVGEFNEIVVDEAAGAVTVRYDIEGWDWDSTLRGVAIEAYDVMDVLFPNPAVQSVTIENIQTVVNPSSGTEQDALTFSVTWSRMTFDAKDWEPWEGVVAISPPEMFCAADDYYIHPGIYPEIEDKDCLLTD